MADEVDEALRRLDERPSENTPMFWLIAGVVICAIGGAVLAMGGDSDLGLGLGYAALGLGSLISLVGATGYGVLLALRQHRQETGGG